MTASETEAAGLETTAPGAPGAPNGRDTPGTPETTPEPEAAPETAPEPETTPEPGSGGGAAGGSDETTGTVWLAFSANLGIAVAKTAAGMISLSSAMLAEAAHSWADTLNEVFLLTSLRRSRRPPDQLHPFGYGKERFFWSLLAAVGIFVTGGLFSIWEGVSSLRGGGHDIDSLEAILNYGVLALALVLEGSSLLRATKQVRGEAQRSGRTFGEHLRAGNDPTVKTVFSEDSAAVIGIALAALGLMLHLLTGDAAYDAAASIAIGVLLVWIAFTLGRDTKALLIGEAADPALRMEIVAEVAAYPEIDALLELLTMQLGPDELLVALRVDLTDAISGDAVEDLSSRIEVGLRARHPSVRHVFVDATRATGVQRLAAQAARDLAETPGPDGLPGPDRPGGDGSAPGGDGSAPGGNGSAPDGGR
jgi:cation diffusion facilitator family transporter